jgi:hypothetical protein
MSACGTPRYWVRWRFRIALETVVEPALAGDVVVDAHDVGRAGVLLEPQQFFGRGFRLEQVIPQGVVFVDPAAQHVPAEPAALVEEIRDLRHFRRAVGARQVVGLHQLGVRIDLADLAHRQHGGAALVDEGAHEGRLAGAVRVPHAVQPREAGGGADLVDRRVVLDPGVAAGHRAGVFRQLFREVLGHQAGMARTAAVVDQADDGRHAQLLQHGQAFVRPRPVCRVDAVRSGALPQHGIADRADAERGKALEVLQPLCMTVAVHLGEVIVAYAVDGAFEPAPELKWRTCGLDMIVQIHESSCIFGPRSKPSRQTQLPVWASEHINRISD